MRLVNETEDAHPMCGPLHNHHLVQPAASGPSDQSLLLRSASCNRKLIFWDERVGMQSVRMLHCFVLQCVAYGQQRTAGETESPSARVAVEVPPRCVFH